jgi:toxin ParE1/3/4
MKVEFTPRAVQDLSDIGDFLRQRSPQVALRVRTAILGSLQTLSLFPQAGRRQTLDGVRKLVVRRYPYLVYYLVDERAQRISILSIQHPAREQPYENL